jgi:hypothetical protein
MDHDRFDVLTRSLGAAASRRTIGRALAGGALGTLFTSGFSALAVDAKRKRHKKKGKKRKRKNQTPPVATPQEVPPLVFNQYGCIDVGRPCRGDSYNCCSGICQGAAPTAGQPDTSRCVAHDTGTCEQAAEGLCTIPEVFLATCNNRSNCGCLRTTGGSNYCAELFGGPGTSQCLPCQRDADCVALGLPAESACAPVSAGRCAGTCATCMACLVPCSTVPPGP